MNETLQANGRLAKVLLASPNANAHFRPTMSLNWLGMQEISLHFADRTFSRIIDFGRIRYLNITNYPGTSRFLRVLAARFRKDGCCLQGFPWLAWDQGETGDSLVPFLRSFTGLRYLRLALNQQPAPFNLGNIISDSATLTRLYFGCGSNHWNVTHSYADARPQLLQSLCQQCVRMQQIIVPLPEVNLDGYEATASNSYNGALLSSQ